MFDEQARPVGVAQRELPQHYPASGWVEHNAEDIWRDSLATARERDRSSRASAVSASRHSGSPISVKPSVVWDRNTGIPIHRAIVWQDRRTADAVRTSAARRRGGDGARAHRSAARSLFFRLPKLAWILDNVPGARARADRGELAFGTIDCFLLSRLTGGKVHATDATNAARTLLFDIHRQQLGRGTVAAASDSPFRCCPRYVTTADSTAATAPALFGEAIPIAGIAGDQQAALFGQACFEPGMAKSTYGTGCFMLVNTGETGSALKQPVADDDGLSARGPAHLCARGFDLRCRRCHQMAARRVAAHHPRRPIRTGCTRVCALTTVSTWCRPLWGSVRPIGDPDARGLICGLTLDVTGAHLVRAALEAVAYQTLDLVRCNGARRRRAVRAIRVDGGMAANNWFCQFLADILEASVERPRYLESSVWVRPSWPGSPLVCGRALRAISATWASGAGFAPRMLECERTPLIDGWRMAVRRATI